MFNDPNGPIIMNISNIGYFTYYWKSLIDILSFIYYKWMNKPDKVLLFSFGGVHYLALK